MSAHDNSSSTSTIPKPAALPIPPFEQACQIVPATGITTFDPLVERDHLLHSLRDDHLERMHKQLWYAGRRGNVSPLHHQRVLHREIVLTESPRLHLVWYDRTIYVQRLPDELLNWRYVAVVACRDAAVHRAACGFLLSYTSLIKHPSDLEIAKHLNLLNSTTTWPAWRAFRASVQHHLAGRHTHDRFEYGELRLGRLNTIFRARGMGMAYFTIHRDYWSYFGHNYMTLVALFALVSVALSAMQVMTAYPRLPGDVMVVLYRCAVVALVAVTASCAALGVLYLGLCARNWTLIWFRRCSRQRAGGGGAG